MQPIDSIGNRIRKALWGDLPPEEYKKIGFLSLIFLFIVGAYWLLRTQKDALFMKITGRLYIPYAKMLSFVIMVPLILIYCKLVDTLHEKHTLFYVICSVYGALFTLVAVALTLPGIGLDPTVPASPSRWLGWIIYVGIESFGSLSVPMFWSFTNSIVDHNSAKSGFGLIVWGAQFGSIGGPTVGRYAKTLGMPVLMLFGAATIFVVPVLVWSFVTYFPQRAFDPMAHRKQTGIVEGLKLLVSHKYLMGIFGIATFYEVIGTILDYQMKFQLDSTFSTASDVAAFMGSFGQWANSLTFLFALFGTGFFINNLGLTNCLGFFPITVGMVALYVWIFPSIHVLFYAMVVIKGLSYALNGPCKEILYIPTTKDVKYKAKSWIDMFGGRAAKSLGSVINTQFSSAAALAFYTGPINLAIICVWFVVAVSTGRKNHKMIDSKIILGEGKIEEGDGVL